MYYLAQDRRVLAKLQSILDAAFPNGSADWSYAEAKNITYVDHIINETLRLRPPVPSGLSRTTPPEGLQIDDVYIPGNTVVSISAHTIQRDPRYYEDPEAFYPERWEGMSPETAPFLAFSRGKIDIFSLLLLSSGWPVCLVAIILRCFQEQRIVLASSLHGWR